MKMKYLQEKKNLMKNEIAVERHGTKNLFFIYLARESQEYFGCFFTWEISSFNSLRKLIVF